METNKYCKLLKSAKLSVTSDLVKECKGDSKKLYKLLGNLTGKVTDNPLPMDNNNQVTANRFADYFMENF